MRWSWYSMSFSLIINGKLAASLKDGCSLILNNTRFLLDLIVIIRFDKILHPSISIYLSSNGGSNTDAGSCCSLRRSPSKDISTTESSHKVVRSLVWPKDSPSSNTTLSVIKNINITWFFCGEQCSFLPWKRKNGRFVPQYSSFSEFGFNITTNEVPQVADFVQRTLTNQLVDSLQLQWQSRNGKFENTGRRGSTGKESMIQQLLSRRTTFGQDLQTTFDYLLQLWLYALP